MHEVENKQTTNMMMTKVMKMMMTKMMMTKLMTCRAASTQSRLVEWKNLVCLKLRMRARFLQDFGATGSAGSGRRSQAASGRRLRP